MATESNPAYISAQNNETQQLEVRTAPQFHHHHQFQNVVTSPNACSFTPAQITGNPSSTGLQWLLNKDPKNKDARRKDSRYQQLIGCIRNIRNKLCLVAKNDPQFGIGVFQAIECYNRIRWSDHCPIDPSNKNHCEAVGSIFERNIRNSNYLKKKKTILKSVQTVETNHDKENQRPLAQLGVGSATAEGGELADSVAELSVEQNCPALATNDFVLVTDKRKTARAAAIVVSPFVVVGDDLDMHKVEIKIVQSISDASLVGDLVTIPIEDLIYIPKKPDDFCQELTDNRNTLCQRGKDCHLKIGGLILLDLDAKFKDNWPLVGEIKSFNQNKTRVTIRWFWTLDDASDDSSYAIDGSFGPWVQHGKVVEETVGSDCHYFCQFDLVDGQLPKCAKLACETRLK